MKRNRTRLLSITLILLLLVSLFALNAAAYNNGIKNIYSGTTNIGNCQIWNNSSTTNRILYGETQANESQNSIVVRIAYTYLDTDTFEKTQATWKTASKSYATVVNTEYAISVAPIEARGQFAINSSVARICKMYNNGQGVSNCEDGASCPYNN